MKYLKVIIIIVLIIIISLVICLISIRNNNNNILNNDNNIFFSNNNSTDKNNINSTNNTLENAITIEEKQNYGDTMNITGKKQKVTSANMFYIIENCVQSYIDNIANKNNIAVYNQLSTSYVLNNGINTDNVLNYVENISETQDYRALQMYYVQGEIYDQYSIYGKMLNNSGNTKELYLILNINTGNLTYSIIPLLNNNYENVSEINISVTNENINKNDNNQTKYIKVTDEQEIKKIMRDYKMNALYDTQSAYNSLDSQYSEERFKDYSDYTKYVQNNINKIRDLSLVSYNKEEKTGYTEYTCIDIYDNYYTIKLKGIMDYTIILDDYTLSKTSDYTNLSDVQKVKYNIRKVIKMLNTCDYTHLYEHLNNTFKTNNFATQEQFENYVKQNLFEYNIITSIEVSESENTTYTSKVEIKNRNSVAANVITKTIIMKLGTGTDFEISFDI